jgi:DNA-binding CsgD family transcriptional regulator
MLALVSPLDSTPSHDPHHRAISASPECQIHPGSLVRRYRTHGPSGPGVYPQCVPTDGDQPHLLAWTNVQHAPAPRADTSGLSSSERGVLEDAANGMTVIETAASRSKSPETVKTQRRSILLKLGARNMAQAVGMMHAPI